MKKSSIILLISVFLISSFLLNFHVIRTKDSIEIVSKEMLSLKDTFVDVRQWGVGDYLYHSSRIREYLIYEKMYPDAIQQVKQMKEKAMTPMNSLKQKISRLEKSFHEWFAEKMK